VPSSCALLGGFAIGARPGFDAMTTSAEREMPASACNLSMPGSNSAISLKYEFDLLFSPFYLASA